MASTTRAATPLNFDPRLLSPSPTADIEFRDTRYFNVAAPALLEEIPPLPLPPTADVLAKCPNAPFGIVTYEHLGVLVKFGRPHKVRVQEAQALQALRRAFPKGEVPVPELYGFKRSGDYSLIYMSIVPGQTLRDMWQDLSEAEKDSIASQLGAIVSTLRGLSQLPNEEHIGKVIKILAVAVSC